MSQDIDNDGSCIRVETADVSPNEKKEISIIEKNKSLAKYGRGVLSITANEDNRLNEILEENIDESVNWYFRGSPETRKRLDQINQLLQSVAPEMETMALTEAQDDSSNKRPISKVIRLKKLNKKLELLQTKEVNAQ